MESCHSSNAIGQTKKVTNVPLQNDVQGLHTIDHITSSTMLYGVIDGFKDGAAIYGSDERLICYNENYRKYFVLAGDTLKPGASFIEIFSVLAQHGLVEGSEEEKRAWIVKRTNLFRDGTKGNEFQRLDGSWVSIDYYKLKDGSTFVVLSNITLRKQAEVDLRESEKSLKEAQRLAKVGNVRWSFKDQKYISYSEEYARILGVTSDQIDEFSSLETNPNVHPEDYERVRARFRETQKAGSKYEDEYRIIRADGEVRDVLEIAEIVRDPNGEAIELVGTLQDITQQKQIDRERETLADERTRDQKLKAMGKLSAGIAHEINSPTQFIGDFLYFLKCSYADIATVINSYRRLAVAARDVKDLAEKVADVERAKTSTDFDSVFDQVLDAIDQSLSGTEQIVNIVSAMKKFSHPGYISWTTVDLNQTLETSVAVSRGTWNAIANVEMDLDPSLPLVKCLGDEISQVFVNLIINGVQAIKATGTDGMGQINLTTCQVGDDVEIRITDTGGGILRDLGDTIFEPFFTTKAVGEGAGLGLSICHDVVVNKHRGRIRFDTEQGVGTTFIINLPIHGAPERLGHHRAELKFDECA